MSKRTRATVRTAAVGRRRSRPTLTRVGLVEADNATLGGTGTSRYEASAATERSVMTADIERRAPS